MQSMKCPCHSGESYPKCCEPFVTGKTSAPTALTLMRSRYTAYAQENRDYLVATWHPETVPLDLSFDGSTVRWDSLSILSQSAGLKDDNDGYVEFEAYFHAGNQTSRMRENSHFKKLDGCWFYVDGEVDRSPNRTIATTAKVGRNEPCPCGSGKKFKKCCG